MLADEAGQSVAELLAAIEAAADRGAVNGGPNLNALPVVEGLVTGQDGAGAHAAGSHCVMSQSASLL